MRRPILIFIWGAAMAFSFVVLTPASIPVPPTRFSNSDSQRLESPVASSLAVTVQVVPAAPIPHDFWLDQNYPNPLNSATVIRYSCGTDAEVSLKVYNILGQQVATLVSARKTAGTHTVSWDCRGDEGKSLPSGIYLYRLVAGSFVQTRKLAILK